MNIPSPDYEQRRTIFELCGWINQKLHDLEGTPKFDEAYFERRGLNIKRLLEEAVPVAYFGLSLWRPWRELSVTCLTGNQAYDAVIEVQDPRNREVIHVEVTTIETEESTMRRQALARDGIVSFTGKVWREGRRIHTEPEMVDVDEEAERILNRAYERFRVKAEREADPQTAILIYVETHLSLPVWCRHQLVERTRKYLLEHRPTFYGVYYCYNREPTIDGLRNDVHELR